MNGRDLFYLDQTGSWTTIIWLLNIIQRSSFSSCYQCSYNLSSFQHYIIDFGSTWLPYLVGHIRTEFADGLPAQVSRPRPVSLFRDGSFIECMKFVCIELVNALRFLDYWSNKHGLILRDYNKWNVLRFVWVLFAQWDQCQMNSARVCGCFELFICLVSRQGSVDNSVQM